MSLDFVKFRRAHDAGDPDRIVRLIIHELSHVWSSDRGTSPRYWRDFTAVRAGQPTFTRYAADRASETFAETVGYFVVRCAANSPYDAGQHDDYYRWVQSRVFEGREFGLRRGSSTIAGRGRPRRRRGRRDGSKDSKAHSQTGFHKPGRWATSWPARPE